MKISPIQAIILLLATAFAFACSNGTSVTQVEDGDSETNCPEGCPNGFTCFNDECRIPCKKDTDCPKEIPHCATAEYCVVAIDGDPDSAEGDGEIDGDVIEDDGDSDESLETEDLAELEDVVDDDTDLDRDSYSDSDSDGSLEQDSDDSDIFDDEALDGDRDSTENQDGAERIDGDPDTSDAECACITGKCCKDGCLFRDSGVLCEAKVKEEIRCGPDGVAVCDQNVETRYLDQVCSGQSAACDGPVVAIADWQVKTDCVGDQACKDGVCVSDAAACCVCNAGSCCDNCRYASTLRVCETISIEVGCPWGNGPGDNVGLKGKYQYCSGASSECTGEIKQSDWVMADDCVMDQNCKDGVCVTNECVWQLNCPDNWYCQYGQCVKEQIPCRQFPTGYCTDSTKYCNTLYAECFALSYACQNNEDCTGNPAGETCDLRIHRCINGTTCYPGADNCYPGTSCQKLDELLGYKGNYCVDCNSGTDCYAGTTCHKRFLAKSVCAP